MAASVLPFLKGSGLGFRVGRVATQLLSAFSFKFCICRRQIWEEMRAAAERNRQQITGQPPRSRPPSQPPSRPQSPPRSQPASRPASRPQSPPQSRPDSCAPSRPASRPHSPPSLDPVQPHAIPRAAAPRQGLPPRAQPPGPALPSGRACPRELPSGRASPRELSPPAAPADIAAVKHAAVQTQPQQAKHGMPPPVYMAAVPQAGAHAQMPSGQQPLQQPASPAGPEMLHQVEFVVPGTANRGGMIPSHRIADLQRAGQDEGSGGSLEGVSELQPIPKLSPRAAAAEEAEFGEMMQELQEASKLCFSWHLCPPPPFFPSRVWLYICMYTIDTHARTHARTLTHPPTHAPSHSHSHSHTHTYTYTYTYTYTCYKQFWLFTRGSSTGLRRPATHLQSVQMFIYYGNI